MVAIKDFSDLRGASRLAIDAITATTDLVEHMHYNIASMGGALGSDPQTRTSGITGLVYRTVRGVSRGVGVTLDLALERLADLYGERDSTPGREALLAALNGILGDHLADSGNPLAIRMQLRRGGRTLALDSAELKEGVRRAGGRILLIAHGLCMNDLLLKRHGHDHGALLAEEFGYFPLYLFYNTGQHISTNGRQLAELLESLWRQSEHPIELSVLAHSMGGLVARSAYHYGCLAGHGWPACLERLYFLGSPHQGAPLERGGNWLHLLFEVTPYTAPFARLGRIRSAGVTDLRHGSLLDEDWQGRDRFREVGDYRHPVPLPEQFRCYAIAASLSPEPGVGDRILGDGLVPLDSALGRHREARFSLDIPESQSYVRRNINHLDLLDDAAVFRKLRRWFGRPGSAA